VYVFDILYLSAMFVGSLKKCIYTCKCL